MHYDPAMKMILPAYWYTLTFDERISVYNGTGPDYFPGWIRDYLDAIFWWAADPVLAHDVEYSYGTSKIMADIRLLINCFLRCDMKPRRIIMSLIAYLGVMLFGRKAWRAGHTSCE